MGRLGLTWAAPQAQVGAALEDNLYLTALRTFWRPTSFYLTMLLAAWTLQHLIAVLMRGDPVGYLASWAVAGAGVVGVSLPYLVTAGGIAWGDYCRDSHSRHVSPILLFGVVVGVASLVFRGILYPWMSDSLYCGVAVHCEGTWDPIQLIIANSGSEAIAGAVLAPINALMGMGIAALTIPKRPLMKLRTHRWAIAVAVWLSGSLLGALIASLDVETVSDAWIVVGTPLIVPALFTLGVLAATRGQAHA